MKPENDFSDILRESKFEKYKPVLIILTTITIVATVSWGVFSYLDWSPSNHAATQNTASPVDDSGPEDLDATTAEDTANEVSETPTTTSTTINTPKQSSASDGDTSTAYDPSKCEPLGNEAAQLKQASDQKKALYDSTFSARRDYGDFYSEVRTEYGNSSSMYEIVAAETDRRYKIQQAQLNQLQVDWQDALKKQNTTYSKYQECRAKL